MKGGGCRRWVSNSFGRWKSHHINERIRFFQSNCECPWRNISVSKVSIMECLYSEKDLFCNHTYCFHRKDVFTRLKECRKIWSKKVHDEEWGVWFRVCRIGCGEAWNIMKKSKKLILKEHGISFCVIGLHCYWKVGLCMTFIDGSRWTNTDYVFCRKSVLMKCQFISKWHSRKTRK